MILVTASVVARADSFDEVQRLGIEHSTRSRAEAGCMSHNVHVDCESPMRLFFFEQWVDEKALRDHFAVPATRNFVRALKELIVETSGARIFQAEQVER